MDNSINYNKDFISVILPWFNRSIYINRVIDSIHEHADFPMEIIIHDDGSNAETVFDLCKKRDKISVLILNSGGQLGLGESINRAVSLASSKYILFMNSDCAIIKPCFKDIIAVLERPYIGVVSTGGNKSILPEYIKLKQVSFGLIKSIGDGSNFAFRKEVWDEIGGFESDITCGCADTPFIYKMWKYGYFRSVLFNEQCIKNMSKEEQQGKDTTLLSKLENKELSYSKLFGPIDYETVCKQRKLKCHERFIDIKNKDASIGNLDYWRLYTSSLFKQLGMISTIDWLKAKKHGQNKWMNIINNEQIVKLEDV